MATREQRQRQIHVVWLGFLAASALVGLLDLTWLWVTATLAATRGLAAGAFWLRVQAARMRTSRIGAVTVPADACRYQVRRTGEREPNPWAETLIGGTLEAKPDGWLWSPHRLSAGAFDRLHVPAPTVQAVTVGRSRDPWMPPADYVQVTTRDGHHVDFLVWDYPRLPPILPWETV